MRRLKNTITALVLSLSFLACTLGVRTPVQAKVPETKNDPLTLVSSVLYYEMDYSTKKWSRQSVTNYTYKKAYPTTIKVKETYADEAQVTKLKYTFRDNGIPKKMTAVNNDGTLTVTYNSKGARYKSVTKSDYSTLRQYFQFAENKNFFSAVLHDGEYYEDDKKTISSTMEETDSISLTLSNGLLKKTVNTGMYANVNAGEKKTWQRFNGTYRADYDTNGILKQTSAKFRMGVSGKEYSFIVKRKNGRITSVTRRRWVHPRDGQKGYWENEGKILFKYTNIKISKQRYSSMINDAVIGSSNNYYFFHWY